MNLLFAVENMYILIRDFIRSFNSVSFLRGSCFFFFNALGFGARTVVLDISPALTGTFFFRGGKVYLAHNFGLWHIILRKLE